MRPEPLPFPLEYLQGRSQVQKEATRQVDWAFRSCSETQMFEKGDDVVCLSQCLIHKCHCDGVDLVGQAVGQRDIGCGSHPGVAFRNCAVDDEGWVIHVPLRYYKRVYLSSQMMATYRVPK